MVLLVHCYMLTERDSLQTSRWRINSPLLFFKHRSSLLGLYTWNKRPKHLILIRNKLEGRSIKTPLVYIRFTPYHWNRVSSSSESLALSFSGPPLTLPASHCHSQTTDTVNTLNLNTYIQGCKNIYELYYYRMATTTVTITKAVCILYKSANMIHLHLQA